MSFPSSHLLVSYLVCAVFREYINIREINSTKRKNSSEKFTSHETKSPDRQTFYTLHATVRQQNPFIYFSINIQQLQNPRLNGNLIL